MEFTAKQIAEFLNAEIQGDENVKVRDFSKIEQGKPGTLTFLSNPKYLPFIYTTEASIVLINRDLELEKEIKPTLLRVKDAYQALAQLLALREKFKPKPQGISARSSVAKTAECKAAYVGDFAVVGAGSTVGDGSLIYPNVTIGENVKIGKNCTIFAGVKIYDDCVIGDDCVLHAGVVIGSDGFGFAPQADGSYQKIPQIGNVVIEDEVEIGANTVIDRATMGSTVIKKGVKLDNLVQIAHNVEVGENTVMASQCGVAGSTKIGRNCVFAGQVGVAGHIQIADGTIIGAQSGIPNSVKISGQTLMGYPALSVGNFRRSSIIYKNLPELQNQIHQLKKRIEELENQK